MLSKKALEYGGLNETVLSHVNVSATLYFVRFEETNQSFGFKILFEVEEPAFVCKPLHVGDFIEVCMVGFYTFEADAPVWNVPGRRGYWRNYTVQSARSYRHRQFLMR
ncbi:MAG: hypothetical protein QXU11_06835 [Thermoproteota archaeon]